MTLPRPPFGGQQGNSHLLTSQLFSPRRQSAAVVLVRADETYNRTVLAISGRVACERYRDFRQVPIFRPRFTWKLPADTQRKGASTVTKNQISSLARKNPQRCKPSPKSRSCCQISLALAPAARYSRTVRPSTARPPQYFQSQMKEITFFLSWS